MRLEGSLSDAASAGSFVYIFNLLPSYLHLLSLCGLRGMKSRGRHAAIDRREDTIPHEKVIAHVSGLVGADVTVTLEIHAEVPSGAPDNVVRTVTENCRTLKFSDHGFENE
jgi:hypothetical protein